MACFTLTNLPYSPFCNTDSRFAGTTCFGSLLHCCMRLNQSKVACLFVSVNPNPYDSPKNCWFGRQSSPRRPFTLLKCPSAKHWISSSFNDAGRQQVWKTVEHSHLFSTNLDCHLYCDCIFSFFYYCWLSCAVAASLQLLTLTTAKVHLYGERLDVCTYKTYDHMQAYNDEL